MGLFTFNFYYKSLRFADAAILDSGFFCILLNLFWNVNNVTVLEFDFVAESETVAFNYVFGSMEYTSYTCSQFNDIFGFFLSGPGIAGPYTNGAVNIALVPETEGAVDYDDWVDNNTGIYTTTPVAINTINDGEMTNDPDCNSIDPNFEDYNIFWYDNDYTGAGWEGVNQPPAPESTVEGITGFTAPLTAVYDGLQCGETYHIKLAIADCWDSALNSVVFFGKSVSSRFLKSLSSKFIFSTILPILSSSF